MSNTLAIIELVAQIIGITAIVAGILKWLSDKKKQKKEAFERQLNEYGREADDIIKQMIKLIGVDAWISGELPEDLSKEEKRELEGEIYHYGSLVLKEVRLKRRGAIPKVTWESWKDYIQEILNKKFIIEYWQKDKRKWLQFSIEFE